MLKYININHIEIEFIEALEEFEFKYFYTKNKKELKPEIEELNRNYIDSKYSKEDYIQIIEELKKHL
jgi:hypothetical protein